MSSATPSRPSSSPGLAILGVVALLVAVVVVALLWFLISGGYFAAFGRWMHASDVGTAVRYVLESLLLLVCLLLSTAVLIYIERKIWGAVQLRRGPNVVGPWGVLQPFADFLKFIFKEPVIPASANKGVFVLAPLVSVVLAFAAWAVIPVTDGWVIADINVGILYLFAVSSLGVYGIIMAGWASNSKYPLLSALARRGADGVLRSLDRLRHRHGHHVRRLAEPQRHRARAGHPLRPARLVLAAAAADVHHLLRLGARRDEPAAVRPDGGGVGARRRLLRSNIRPRCSCCSS